MAELDEILDAVRPLFARLSAHLEQHPQLRSELAELARSAAVWLSSPQKPVEQLASEARPSTLSTEPIAPQAAVTNFTFSTGTYSERIPYEDWALVPFEVLMERCQVKADAACLVARRLKNQTPDHNEADIRSRAMALPDCPLWMLAEPPLVTNSKTWDHLRGAYYAASAAAAVLYAWTSAPDSFRSQNAPEILALAAEAQSLLMYAVADTRGVRQDFEQIQLFVRVREATRNERVFLSRYMKREDRADPATWANLLARLTEALERLRGAETREKNKGKHLNNLKFKLRKGLTESLPTEEWQRIFELLEQVHAAGEAIPDTELKDLLLQSASQLPAGSAPPASVAEFFVPPKHVEPEPELEPDNPQDIEDVAQKLQRREMVIVGEMQPAKVRAELIPAFRMADVRCVLAMGDGWKSEVEQPNVAMVVILANVPATTQAAIVAMCKTYEMPWVQLENSTPTPHTIARLILGRERE